MSVDTRDVLRSETPLRLSMVLNRPGGEGEGEVAYVGTVGSLRGALFAEASGGHASTLTEVCVS